MSILLASQVVHENPDTLTTSTVTPVGDQVSALVDHMASDLETISSLVHEENYTAAREASYRFSRDGGSLKDLIGQFNISGQYDPALGSDLGYMQADLNDLLEYADQYDSSLALYNASLASGDSANASFYSGRLRASYANLGLAYNKLYTNATSAGGMLSDMGIDTGQYASAIDDLNAEINRLVYSAPIGAMTNGADGNASLDYQKFIGKAGESSTPAIPVPTGNTSLATYSNGAEITSVSTPTTDIEHGTADKEQYTSSGSHSFTSLGGSLIGAAGRLVHDHIAIISLGLVILIVIILIAGRLFRRTSVPRPEISDAVPAQGPAPPVSPRVEKPIIETEMISIVSDLDSKNNRKAQKGIYFLTLKASAFKGMVIRDSMTPREVQRATSTALPAIFSPLSTIISSYEKAAFAPEELEQVEVLRSIDCMREIFTMLDIGRSEAG